MAMKRPTITLSYVVREGEEWKCAGGNGWNEPPATAEDWRAGLEILVSDAKNLGATDIEHSFQILLDALA